MDNWLVGCYMHLQGVQESLTPPLLAIFILHGPASHQFVNFAEHFAPPPGTLLSPVAIGFEIDLNTLPVYKGQGKNIYLSEQRST
jgi:hypothetical protein